nr:DUF3035 domain-containing protein [uncultured Neokomagataea sp.]
MIAFQGLTMRFFRIPAVRLCAQIGAVASFGVMLSGCSGDDVSRAFGMERIMPDEYTVTTRAPLSMPPSEKMQLPGAADAHRPDESPRMQALETLSPDTALHPVSGGNSAGQTALVDQATQASHSADNAELGNADAGFVDNLMFWSGGKAGGVVDGDGENRRIRENTALGRKPTTGATPTVTKKTGHFLGVF